MLGGYTPARTPRCGGPNTTMFEQLLQQNTLQATQSVAITFTTHYGKQIRISPVFLSWVVSRCMFCNMMNVPNQAAGCCCWIHSRSIFPSGGCRPKEKPRHCDRGVEFFSKPRQKCSVWLSVTTPDNWPDVAGGPVALAPPLRGHRFYLAYPQTWCR
eukprot:890016-Amphidinium_carterae.1